MFSKIYGTQGTSGSYPGSLEQAAIFTEDLGPSFNHQYDVVPEGWFGKRRKYIHSMGASGKVHWKANANAQKYTGIFKGGKYGIIRFSSGVKPSESQPLVPTFAVKMLRDGQHSANLFT